MKSEKTKLRVAVLLDTRQLSAHAVIGGIMRYAMRHPDLDIVLCGNHSGNDGTGWDEGLSFHGLIADSLVIETPYRRLLRQKSLRAAVFTSQHTPAGFKGHAAEIDADNRAIAETAARVLTNHGLVNFGFVGTCKKADWSDSRFRHFANALRARGLTVSRYVSRAGANVLRNTERKALASWISSLPKPCGIFSAYDQRSVHVLDVCREQDIAVPEQVQVISVDNEPYVCELTVPTLSSIAIDFESGGYALAEALDGMMRTNRRSCGIRRLSYPVREVVERESTTDLHAVGNRVTRARDFIRRNACSGIGVMAVVRAVGGSRRLLEMNFQTVLGRSIGEEILSVKLTRAKELLRSSSQSLDSIAPQCGFRANNHLRNLFKRRFGMTMSEFRKSQ